MKGTPDIDRGWAWIVLVAACLSVLLGSGLAFVGGLVQALFLEQFKESVAFTAWVTALFSSLLQLAGPLSSFVANYFSCRVAVMLGGALLSIGLALSSFVDGINVLILTYGVIAGLGLGLTYTSSIVITNYYFRTKRNIMTGVVMSAAGVGLFVFPLLIRYFIDVLSWRETLMILAAASAQLCVCGACMFPVHETPKKWCIKGNEKRASALECSRKKLSGIEKVSGSSTSVDTDTVIMERKKQNPSDNEHERFLNSNHSLITSTLKDRNWINSNGSMLFNSQLCLASLQNVHIPSNREYKNLRSSKYWFLWNKPFLLFCLNLFLTNTMYGGLFIHYPLWCRTQGGSETDIAFALSFHGPALTFSRLLVGSFGNSRNVDYLCVYMGLKFVGGVFICLIPFYGYSQTSSIVVMVVIGIYIAGTDSLNAGLTIDCVGLDQLASAFGMQMVCAGMGYLVMPPIVGWVVDITGTYGHTLYISGSVCIAAAVVCLIIPLTRSSEDQHIGYHPQTEESIDIEVEDKTCLKTTP